MASKEDAGQRRADAIIKQLPELDLDQLRRVIAAANEHAEKATLPCCLYCGRIIAGGSSADSSSDQIATSSKATYKNKKFCRRLCKDRYYNERKRSMNGGQQQKRAG